MNLREIIVLICLLAGGSLFFSVNAIALQIFSRARLQEAFRAAGRENFVDNLVKHSEKLAWSCTLYRLICNMGILILLLVLFTTLRHGPLRTVDYLTAFAAAILIFSIFSLMIPHAWAKYAGEKILGLTYGILMSSAIPVWPILYVFQLYDNLVRRLTGAPEATPERQEEEFLTELEMQKLKGVVDEEEQEMIENVLELSETTAGEIMTPRTDMAAVEASAGLQAILDTITLTGHSRVPVYENNIDNVIGFIYAKDLLTEVGKNPLDFRPQEKLRPAYFIPETKPLRELLHEFQDQKLHIAVVIDEYGGTAGIISIEDILEELVGEITDEYEKSRPKYIKKIDPNTIEADAKTLIYDLNNQCGLSLPESEDYDTIGGFVLSQLGYVPQTGESFDYKNLKFIVVAAETRRIKRIRVQKTTESKIGTDTV